MDEKLNYRVVAKHANGNDVVLQEYDGIVMNDHAMFDIEPGATKEQMHEKFSLLQEERSAKLREQQAQRVQEIGRRPDTVDGPVHAWPDPYLHERGEIASLSAEEFQQHLEKQEQRVQEIGRQEPHLDANNNYNLNSEVDDNPYLISEEQMMEYRERLLKDVEAERQTGKDTYPLRGMNGVGSDIENETTYNASDRVKMTEQMLETASERLSAKSPHTLHFDDYINLEKEATYNASDRVKMTEQMLETASEQLSAKSPHTLHFDDYVNVENEVTHNASDRTLMSEQMSNNASSYNLRASTFSEDISYVDIPEDNKSTVRAVEGKMSVIPEDDNYTVRAVEGKMSVIPEADLKALKTIAKNEMARNKEAVSKTGVDKNANDVELDV